MMCSRLKGGLYLAFRVRFRYFRRSSNVHPQSSSHQYKEMEVQVPGDVEAGAQASQNVPVETSLE